MFGLLSSFWLVALAGLVVPIAIHLWNKKQPRLVKVGSIKWLQASASKRLNSIKLQDWPLLVLRCLILLALVIFLCQPFWRREVKSIPEKNIFIAPELLASTNLSELQSTLDSSVAKGYILRSFKPDFGLIIPEEWARIKSGETKITLANERLNNWQLAENLNYQFADASENIIFLSNNINHYQGNRPVLKNNVRVVIIPDTSARNWIQEAYLTEKDTLTLIIGHSEAEKTFFISKKISFPNRLGTISIAGLPPVQLHKNAGKSYINFSGDSNRTEITTQPLYIALVADNNRKEDIRYVRAALGAIQQYTSRLLVINQNSTINANWIFWLSDKKIPTDVVNQTKNGLIIFKDASGQNNTTSASWFSGNSFSVPSTSAKQIIANQSGTAVWRNNFGEAILSFEKMGNGGIYHFNSRFNSTWNSLPESTLLPELLSNLLFEKQQFTNFKMQARVLDNEQVQPVFKENISAKSKINLPMVALKYWFLATAVFLFILERVWAYFKTRIPA